MLASERVRSAPFGVRAAERALFPLYDTMSGVASALVSDRPWRISSLTSKSRASSVPAAR